MEENGEEYANIVEQAFDLKYNVDQTFKVHAVVEGPSHKQEYRGYVGGGQQGVRKTPVNRGGKQKNNSPGNEIKLT